MNILDDIVQSQFESSKFAGRVSSWQTAVPAELSQSESILAFDGLG